MKVLPTIVVLLLVLVIPVACQQSTPTVQQCQADRAALEKLIPFRSLSASEMQIDSVNMAVCATVDRDAGDAYRHLSLQLHVMLDTRIRQFVIMNGLWDTFVSWDSNPDNRI